jgi:hypothetical protein
MSTSKKMIAGKASGIRRAKLAKVRRYYVLSAHEQLEPKYRNQPYSSEALDALEKEFHNPTKDEFVYSITNAHELAEGGRRVGKARRPASERLLAMLDDVVPIICEGIGGSLRKVSRETLIKDLKALGIRSKRRQRSK